jgi:hypothetical protein
MQPLTKGNDMCRGIPGATLVFVTSFVLIFGGVFSAPAMAALERQPYLQSTSDTRVVLRWRTTSSDSSRVSYGSSIGNLNTQVDLTGLRTEHEVVITGLAANTKYFYAVGSVSGSIEAGNDTGHYFITAPEVGSSRKIRIWAIGDAGTGKPAQDDVRDAYYNLDDAETDVVLALGDNAYSDGTESDYTNNFFNVYNGLLKQAPVWSTRGNHDRSSGIYETAFTHPTQAEGGGIASGSELYYSFDYGNIHFVCLDSFTDSNLKGTAMYTWLENDLASTLQKWIIAYWHHPPYSRSSAHDSDRESGQRLSRKKANPILESYGVDLQLGGHNHFYSRTVLINNHYGLSNTYDTDIHAIDPGNGRGDEDGVYRKESNPEGAVYVLAGSSGKIDYTPIPHPANFIEDVVLGSMVIDVEGDRMDVRMLRENGTVQDYFSITKAPQPNQAPRVDAGNDQSAETGVAINLDASVNDDGLPAGMLTYGWIKVNGPGIAAFANVAGEDTRVSFSAAGSYTLQLEASDGELSASDQILITVTDPAGAGIVTVADPNGSGNAERDNRAGSVDAGLLLGFSILALLRWLVMVRFVYIGKPGSKRGYP